MEEVLIVAVLSLPVFALAGFIVAMVALFRAKRLQKRVVELESQQGIGATHPISQRLRDLQERVAILESQPADAAEPAKPPVQPVPPVEAPPVSPVPPEPPVTPAPAEARPPIPQPSVIPAAAPVPTASAPPPSDLPPPKAHRKPRAKIEWERWIGVRGAAAAGGIVLALAALLFFQYSIEHGLISPTMRVVFGVLAGIGCIAVSEWLIKRHQAAAANALAGAGVVILYGATWAAQTLYGLIGTVPAFVLMVVITVVCVAMAVSRGARFIAVLGLLGGFATPMLVASDVDSPAALFGYILLLNLGLLWLARARGWPMLSILSLAGTALHQAIWIFGTMDAERAVLGVGILAVFGLAFLFFSSGEREPSFLWRATRAGGVAIPFAFAVHFASTTELAENPWPFGMLLLILSAGACWLARHDTRGAAIAAAAASLGIMAVWFLNHRVTPELAWQAVALCVALAALFTIAAELSRQHPSAHRLGLGALLSSLGFLALLVFATIESRVVAPWPWLAGWTAVGALIVLHSRWPRRAWIQLAAGLGPACGLFITIVENSRRPGALEPWAYFTLIVAVALVFQVLAVLIKTDERRVWAERTAAATALALMPAAAVLLSFGRGEAAPSLMAIMILGLLATLSATRMRSGPWLLAATGATAFWQTLVYFAEYEHAAAGTVPGSVLGLLAFSAILFTVWPALVAAAFSKSRSGWWAAALAGPLWFFVLKSAFVATFGDGAIGILPVALAVVSLVTGLFVRSRLAADADTRLTALVWYLAVALSMVSVAIPLQLEKEWITIGWAINGFAILSLWIRLDHPGLKYFGLALLGAATIRLVANTEVLDYHIRVGTPVVNWLTYTYLVPALALILSHRLLKAREVDRLRGWEERVYPGGQTIGAAACGLAAVAVIFVWINLAIADLFATGPNLELSFQRLPARDATTSVAWAVYALVLLAIGVRSKSGSMRWLSLGMFVLTLGKVFLHDLGELEDLYRVGSLVGLALSLIIVSLIYQRFVFRADPEEDV